MESVIVIVGPTASGKTALSVELAKRINGSVVSADSMQIYRFMDIGTAKPDEEERAGIKHHMIDVVDPSEPFSVAKYREMALECLARAFREGSRPVIAGGTGLYINSLLYNITFSETICDEELRESLHREAADNGNRYLYEKLVSIDPEAAAKIHENDVKRVIRAIEVFVHTNRPISEHARESRQEPPPYQYIVYGLNWERKRLYERINERVDRMIRNGLAEEVRKLVDMGYDKGATAMQGIGYKEMLEYLRGNSKLDETVELLKQNTRHYAKRQLTWFRRIEGIHWLDIDDNTDLGLLAEKIIHECIATDGIFL